MPESLITRILTDPRKAAAEHSQADIPPPVLRELFGQTDQPEVRLFLALYPGTPGRVLEQLATPEADANIRGALAGHGRAPAALLAGLADDADPEIRVAVARNRAVTPQVALALAGDPDWRVRRVLAENPALPPRVQHQLAQDDLPLVRSGLLQQTRPDPDSFDILLDDEDLGVRARALLSSALDGDALLARADGDRKLDQLLLLQRRSPPDEVLESLSFSPHAAVQRRALSARELALDEWVGWASEGTPAVRTLIAAHEKIPAPVQALLVEDADSRVRAALASNHVLRPRVAAVLADDEASEVRRALAANPQTPPEALTRLLLCDDPVLRKHIAGRPDLRPEHRDVILGTGDDGLIYHLAVQTAPDPDLPAAYAHRLQQHELPTLRAYAAAARCLTASMINRLLHDPAPAVRQALCGNPKLTDEQLHVLCGDRDPGVEEYAGQALATRRREPEDSPETAEVPEPEPVPAARRGMLRRLLRRMGSGGHGATDERKI